MIDIEFSRNLSRAFRYSGNKDFKKHCDIEKLFYDENIQIKQDLVKDIKDNIPKVQDINILGGNMPFTYMDDLLSITDGVIYSFDIDPYIKVLNHGFYQEETTKYNKCRFRDLDIWKESNVRYASLNIFPNLEHLPPIKFWEGYANQRDSYFVFSANNLKNQKDHSNAISSLEEFENQMHDMFDIQFSVKRTYDRPQTYKRAVPKDKEHLMLEPITQYTIIGKMC